MPYGFLCLMGSCASWVPVPNGFLCRGPLPLGMSSADSLGRHPLRKALLHLLLHFGGHWKKSLVQVHGRMQPP